MNIAIVGCGLIGRKRAALLGEGTLVACADLVEAHAQALAATVPGCRAFTRWQDVLALPEVDMVIVATRHDALAAITEAAIRAGRHVLVEKPGARCPEEIEPLISLAREMDVLVRVGFNHRYHRAVRKALGMIAAGEAGEIMFLRARYGHGGRPGYDREWRAIPEQSGGGELIDQGPHLIDLSRCILGEVTRVQGVAQTCYWDMPVDDNAFLLLRHQQDKTAFLHVSCTEWKNLFSMEIYGRDAKLEISGLGGSYGVETLKFYKMLPQMGPPETTIWEYPMADDSWAVELTEFYEDIRLHRRPAAGLPEALAALRVVQTVMKESKYDFSA